MSNQYHVVLHVDKGRAEAWTREEVVERWLQLYKGSVLVNRWLKDPKAMDKASLDVVYALIEVWRERLYDISWFMRGVRNYCSDDRRGGKLQGSLLQNTSLCFATAGRLRVFKNIPDIFVGGGYKSQALLDETALLSCMAYVDLNPIRMGWKKIPKAVISFLYP